MFPDRTRCNNISVELKVFDRSDKMDDYKKVQVTYIMNTLKYFCPRSTTSA